MQTTVFSKKMGKALSDVPIFGQGFNSWFPIVVVVWCGMLFLNVWGGIARVCLPSRYRFSEGGSSEHHERGRTLLRKEQVCAAALYLCLCSILALRLLDQALHIHKLAACCVAYSIL